MIREDQSVSLHVRWEVNLSGGTARSADSRQSWSEKAERDLSGGRMRTSMKTLEASSAEPLIPRCLSSLLSLMFPVSPTAPDPTRVQVNDSTRGRVQTSG